MKTPPPPPMPPMEYFFQIGLKRKISYKENEENKIARGPFPLKDTKFAFYVFLSRQANEQNNFLIFII